MFLVLGGNAVIIVLGTSWLRAFLARTWSGELLPVQHDPPAFFLHLPQRTCPTPCWERR